MIRAARGLPADDDVGGNNIVAFPGRRVEKRWISIAMAASVLLVVGVITTNFYGGKPGTPVDASYVKLLNSTLESVPSGEVQESVDGVWQILPVATFETKTRGICREYAGLHGTEQFFGLACRGGVGKWNRLIDYTFEATISDLDAGTYVPAEGEVDMVSKKLTELGGGRALKYDEEHEWLKRNWR